MPRPTKQAKHCQENGRKRKKLEITNIIRYVISIAICGMSEQQAALFLLYNDISPPTKAQFYACQKKLIPLIEKYARENCNECAELMTDGFLIRYDGSWSSKRNASHCLVEIINENGQIIDFEMMSKIKFTYQKVETGYFGPSNSMETHLIEILSERWKNHPNLKGYVHDGDLKSPKFWINTNKDDVPIIELHDPGHAKKSIEKIFDAANSNKKLYGLKKQVIGYFAYLCKVPKLTAEDKIARWKNIELKLMEKPPKRSYLHPTRICHKKLYDQCHSALEQFICKSMNLFQSCIICDTQSNESFHSLKSKFAPKNIAWGTSWKLRMCLAILRWNLGENFRPFLEEKLQLNISIENSGLLKRIESSLAKKRYIAKSEEAKHLRNTHRKLKRESNKNDPEGHQYTSEENKQKIPKKKKRKKH